MIIAFDIGNTTVAIGLFKEGKLVHNWKIRSDRDKTCDEYGLILRNLLTFAGHDIDGGQGGDHLERRSAAHSDLSSPEP